MKYKVLIACGTGIATSTVIAKRVENLLKENGYEASVEQCKVVEVSGKANDYDLIVASTKVPESVKTPKVQAINYLTGVNMAKTDNEILEIMKNISKE
ncbi:PTS sugar transporter subunit IIB [Alkalibacter saccharofermentans]|uniref:PTS system, galactitol-specific IIB component n=1 Tax=Alkalibacter saccharofermentans DSM 14828 TaxID=1120975 RepID=A0A1M4UTU2_9FIRM|nr:PTS sugar transporter subunit IIB [Alkalibacter saccharofermentans]SHE60099.1 PTS system, galactitol-specific IIB component [Alkalibacter saccharofermentans DSM 14828]